MIRRTLRASVAAALAATALATPAMAEPPSAGSVSVCNEAENSFQGGYTVSGGTVDPVPPAFLRGSQMRVGQGHGAGLLNAAQRSPALRECGVPAPPTGGGTGGDGGGTGGGTGGGDGGGGIVVT